MTITDLKCRTDCEIEKSVIFFNNNKNSIEKILITQLGILL